MPRENVRQKWALTITRLKPAAKANAASAKRQRGKKTHKSDGHGDGRGGVPEGMEAQSAPNVRGKKP